MFKTVVAFLLGLLLFLVSYETVQVLSVLPLTLFFP
jgi:hypothetical protein